VGVITFSMPAILEEKFRELVRRSGKSQSEFFRDEMQKIIDNEKPEEVTLEKIYEKLNLLVRRNNKKGGG